MWAFVHVYESVNMSALIPWVMPLCDRKSVSDYRLEHWFENCLKLQESSGYSVWYKMLLKCWIFKSLTLNTTSLREAFFLSLIWGIKTCFWKSTGTVLMMSDALAIKYLNINMVWCQFYQERTLKDVWTKISVFHFFSLKATYFYILV